MGRRQKIATLMLRCTAALVFFLLGPTTTPALAKKTPASITQQPKLIVSTEISNGADLSEFDRSLDSQIPAKLLREADQLHVAADALRDDDAPHALGMLKSIADSTLLGDYVRYYESVALKKVGRYEDALKLLPETFNFTRRLDWDEFWHKLDILSLTKRIKDLRQVIAIAQKHFVSDRMAETKAAYYLGKGLLLAGQQAEAYRQFQTVLVKNPGTEYDDRILALLKQRHVAPSAVLPESLLSQRAKVLIATGYADQGRAIYEMLAHKNPAVYKEKLAHAYFHERRYVDAARLYSEVLKSGHFDMPKLSLLVKLGQAYGRSDNFTAALAINQKIISSYPSNSAAVTADYKTGFLYFDSGQYAKAMPYFDKYALKGSGKMREDARWFRLWSDFLSKNYVRALDDAKALLATAGRGEKAMQFTYWIGRIQNLMGHHTEAKLAYQKVAELNPTGYYGLLSRQRIVHGSLAPKTLFDAGLMQELPEGHSPVESPLLSRVGLSDALLRAILLYRAGFDNDAFSESQSVAAAFSGRPSRDAVLALELSGNSYFSFAEKAAAMSGRVSDCDSLCAYRVAYPLAYEKYIRPFSARFGLDDKLAYAIMRQESAFKPEVSSNAYAYGLMQIIPPTGREIADKIHYSGFHPDLLIEPRLNTLFGTFYLSDLMNRFGADSVLAMAAYNAGPDAVTRWLKKYSALDRDIFVELIPYAQTRDYVKRVLVNYMTYQKLYP